ncbi:hypothetical protein DPMN_112190 [Dreissena polymorpha]|uniref:Uncharacterized protein n=1 Tax=Dreissena polymorpha TaxID=45954 RepID=A0A9D4KF71_DREPO|nr:hypothetical protein DPMN_112190 [Dreissena polymorpha]
MSFLSRETMESAGSYQEARDKLANTQLIAPAYFILGGTKPGEVWALSSVSLTLQDRHYYDNYVT